jgi:hypothetical protein
MLTIQNIVATKNELLNRSLCYLHQIFLVGKERNAVNYFLLNLFDSLVT